jgi:hypothetical protein
VVVEQNTLSEAAKHGKSRRDRLMPRIVPSIRGRTTSSGCRRASWTISRGSRVCPRRS